MVQAVAARARTLSSGDDPLELATRSRVQTRTGAWLLLYGTPLAGGSGRQTAVILQPATPNEVAPLIALAHGLTERETQIVQLCMQGRSTKEIAGGPRVGLHRPGPPEVDLRQDQRAQPQRARRPDLPRALRAPLGRHRRADRMDSPFQPGTGNAAATLTTARPSPTGVVGLGGRSRSPRQTRGSG